MKQRCIDCRENPVEIGNQCFDCYQVMQTRATNHTLDRIRYSMTGTPPHKYGTCVWCKLPLPGPDSAGHACNGGRNT